MTENEIRTLAAVLAALDGWTRIDDTLKQIDNGEPRERSEAELAEALDRAVERRHFTIVGAREIIALVDAGCAEYRECIPLGVDEEELRVVLADDDGLKKQRKDRA
jgi:hypothetical protein